MEGMNIIAFVHVVSGIILIVLCVPLIRRAVRMNAWYGIRIRAAFESEERWYDINEYGGRMFLRWGFVIVITGLMGLSLPLRHWIVYAFVSLVVIVAGAVIAMVMTMRYAGRSK